MDEFIFGEDRLRDFFLELLVEIGVGPSAYFMELGGGGAFVLFSLHSSYYSIRNFYRF